MCRRGDAAAMQLVQPGQTLCVCVFVCVALPLVNCVLMMEETDAYNTLILTEIKIKKNT